jgi:hypothetical protein
MWIRSMSSPRRSSLIFGDSSLNTTARTRSPGLLPASGMWQSYKLSGLLIRLTFCLLFFVQRVRSSSELERIECTLQGEDISPLLGPLPDGP